MLNALKQSTAATLYVGPVLDADANPLATAVIGDFQIVKNGSRGNFDVSAVATHDAAGHYTITAQVADTNTLGRLTVVLNKAGYVMPPKAYQVVPAAIFTALVDGSTSLAPNAAAIASAVLDEPKGSHSGLLAGVALPGDAMCLTTDERAALVAALVGGSTGSGFVALTPEERQAIADALLDRTNGVEVGITVRQAMRIMSAVLAGKVSGSGNSLERFTGLDGATPRVAVAADAAGNRTLVNYTAE